MKNVLIVRTSSMGDLIHTWPAITELKAHYPNTALHWLAEESFADIARLHPAIDQVLTLNWRAWRKNLFKSVTWKNITTLRQSLGSIKWDQVIDSQGLFKSALLASWAKAPIAGYGVGSAREFLACAFYDKRYTVSWSLPAVERNRQLFGNTFGYQPQGAAQFGIPLGQRPAWLPIADYVVLLHATSRRAKEWPASHWIALGQRFYHEHGLSAVLPWGNRQEQQTAEQLAAQIPQAQVAPKMSLKEAAGLLGNAQAVVGVDTGLSHLANALNVPLLAIYTDTNPAHTGVVDTPWAMNLGNIGACPSVEAVWEALLSRRGMR